MKIRLLASVVIFMGAALPVYSDECTYPKGEDVSALISFLGGHTSMKADSCVDQAFEKLNRDLRGTELSDAQISILIRLLDHRRLPTEAEQKGFDIHFSPRAEQYPAITSLFIVGPCAASLLLQALGSAETPLLRENAVFTWSLIYRDDPAKGVRALSQAASSQKDMEQMKNLKSAAIAAARSCPGSFKSKCDSELPR
jgi:hypothetical protein